MGRFRAEAIVIKKVDDLTIVFYDRERIYIKDKSHGWTLFHRYYTQLGFYGSCWKPFRKLLMVEKRITFNHCYRLAFRYDIQSRAGVKPPNLEGRATVERILPSKDIKNKEVN